MKKVWSDFIKSSTRESNARDFYNAYKFAFVGDLARAQNYILILKNIFKQNTKIKQDLSLLKHQKSFNM